jgi:chromosome segregation ATPase
LALNKSKIELETKYARLDALNKQCERDTLDRRTEYRRAIAMKNAVDFAVRNAGQQIDTTISKVNTKIKEIDEYLAQYPEFRRQINEDYYNWQQDTEKINGELTALTTLTMELVATGRKPTPRIFNQQARLQTVSAELMVDKRQDPTARYLELEKTMEAHRNQKRILENRRRTLESRLATTPQTKQEVRGTIRLPTYFKEDVESYKKVKRDYDTCKTALSDVNAKIEQMHARLMDLSEKSSNPEYMSPELQEHRIRARERLHRVNARLDSEYSQQIAAVRARILELEASLANTIDFGSSQAEPEPKAPIPSAPVQQTVQTVRNRRELKLAQMQAHTPTN